MHLIYRSKKQTLPIVAQNKITASIGPNFRKNQTTQMLRKKSIDIVFDKKLFPLNVAETAMIYNPPHRKTFYRKVRSKKSQSGYLKGSNTQDQPILVIRNKSTQITQRQTIALRKAQFSPYVQGQKRSKSSSKITMQRDMQEKQRRDPISQRLIEKEIYSIQEGSDFN